MENEQAPDLLLILSTRAETMPGLCNAISYLIKWLNGRFPLWLNGRFLFLVLSVYQLLQSLKLTVTFKGNNSRFSFLSTKERILHCRCSSIYVEGDLYICLSICIILFFLKGQSMSLLPLKYTIHLPLIPLQRELLKGEKKLFPCKMYKLQLPDGDDICTLYNTYMWKTALM